MTNIFNKPIIRLHLHSFIFTPQLIPTLGLIILLPILLKLGFWQLHRAAYKNQLETNFIARQNQAPLELNQLQGKLDHFEYYSLKISGKYDNQHQFFLDNQVQDHNVGYQVLTPLIPEKPNLPLILVNRGWVPRLMSYNQLPVLQPVIGTQTIIGIIKQAPKKTFVLSHREQYQHWPVVIESIEIKKIAQVLNHPVYPFILLLSAKNANGFVREWKPNVGMPASRHLGYAIQWFALALTLVIIYFVVNTRRNPHERSSGSH